MTDSSREPIPQPLDDPGARSATTETYPEARGPHLPDTVTRLGALVWVFLLLGAARLIWFVRESPPSAPYDLASIITYGAGIAPSVVVVLFPAALLFRHPDATNRARTLLLGTVLFTIVEAMRVLSPPLRPVFEQLTPGSPETPYLVPLALVYDAVIRLLGAYALANIAVGLARARRYEDPSDARVVTAVMAVAVSLVAVGGIVSVSRLRLDEITITPTVIAFLVSSVLLSVAFAAAWAYVAVVTIRGAQAGEMPVSGWSAAAIGSGLIITDYVASSVLMIVATPTPETQPLFTNIGYALSITVAIGYLLLLAALFLGLPSLDDDEEATGEEETGEEETNEEDAAGRDAAEIEPA